MRRIVRDCVAAAIERQKEQLEANIAERLEYPDSFPLVLADLTVSIREIGRVNIVPRLPGDCPPIDATVTLRVAITATSERRETACGIRTAAVPDSHLGRRTFAIDVEYLIGGKGASTGVGVVRSRGGVGEHDHFEIPEHGVPGGSVAAVLDRDAANDDTRWRSLRNAGRTDR